MRKNSNKIGMYRIIILSCSLPEKKMNLVFWQFSSFHLQVETTFSSSVYDFGNPDQ
jgi:hypothetical protein